MLNCELFKCSIWNSVSVLFISKFSFLSLNVVGVPCSWLVGNLRIGKTCIIFYYSYLAICCVPRLTCCSSVQLLAPQLDLCPAVAISHRWGFSPWTPAWRNASFRGSVECSRCIINVDELLKLQMFSCFFYLGKFSIGDHQLHLVGQSSFLIPQSLSAKTRMSPKDDDVSTNENLLRV